MSIDSHSRPINAVELLVGRRQRGLHLPGAELGSELAPLVCSEGALGDARDSDTAPQLVNARLQQLPAARANHPRLHLAILQRQRLLHAHALLACSALHCCLRTVAQNICTKCLYLLM